MMLMITSRYFLLFLLAALCLSTQVEAEITVETLSLEKVVAPGEIYQGTITVTNNGDQPQKAVVYQTDYSFHSDGSNQFGIAGEMARSNADWVSFSPRLVEVPPHQSSWISYEVRVPNDSALTGTYWSMLMVEQADQSSDSIPRLRRNQAAVRQVVRYGIQCVTHVGGSGFYHLQFTGTQLVIREDQEKELQVDVENVGKSWAVPIAWVDLFSDNGHHIGRFQSEKKRIYPDTSVKFRIALGDIPAGKYKALVVLDSGDQNVLGAKYNLEF
jgi:P pilus assembly chaperone PapD